MASFLSFFLGEKKKTASVAKERLQIILAHERSGRHSHEPDYLPALQRDLIAVISKYIKINPDDIKVNRRQVAARWPTLADNHWRPQRHPRHALRKRYRRRPGHLPAQLIACQHNPLHAQLIHHSRDKAHISLRRIIVPSAL